MTPRPKRLHLLRCLPNTWVETLGGREQKSLYLSFDDGPHPQYTQPLLDFLAEHDALATFFLIGEQIERHPQLARRIVDAGHTLGNHSYTHPHFELLPLAAQLDEIDRTDKLLQAIDGRPWHPFRPPRGVLPRPMLRHFIRQHRRIAYWSYDSLDYSRRPAAELVALARRYPPRSGDILLMHDDSDISMEMLTQLIPQWKQQGFRFAALRPDPLPRGGR